MPDLDHPATEELIPEDLFRRGALRPAITEDSPKLAYWLAAGLPFHGALALAEAGILSLADLSGWTREDLVALPGFGRASLRVCERRLGHTLPAHRPDPDVDSWRSHGFRHAAAAALSQAGIRSLEDLSGWDRDRLESLRGIGPADLRRCEALLGRPLPPRRDYWIERELSPRIARCLIAAGIHILDDLARLTRDEFLLRPDLGATALGKCEALLGRRLHPSPAKQWQQRGCKRPLARKLSEAGIRTGDDLHQTSDEALTAAGLTRAEIAFCRRLTQTPAQPAVQPLVGGGRS
jgi:hypothetical protein